MKRFLRTFVLSLVCVCAGGATAFAQVVSPLHRIGTISSSPSAKFAYLSTNIIFAAEGNNYIKLNYRPEVSPWPYHVTFNINYYDPSSAEAALTQMHNDGYNVVRVWIDAGGGPQQAEGGYGVAGPYNTNSPGLYQPYMNNFIDFLRRANAHNIYVTPVLDYIPHNVYYLSLAYSNVPPSVEGDNAQYLSQGAIDAKKTYLGQFVSTIKAANPRLLSTIFSYELQNEIYVRGDQQPFSLSSGIVSTADGGTYNMADGTSRQQCQDSNMVNWANQASSAIHAIDPAAMVSASVFTYRAVGKSGPNGLYSNGSEMRFPARPLVLRNHAAGLAYIDIHLYPSPNNYSIDADLNSSEFHGIDKTGKPFLMGEFGAFTNLYPNINDAALAMKAHRQNAYDRGFAGALLWTWDTPPVNNSNVHPALYSNGAINGQLAPAARATWPNPIDISRFFAYQQYLDILTRDADEGGLSAWENYINQCGSDAACLNDHRIITARGFFESPELRNNNPLLTNPGSDTYHWEYVRLCYVDFLRRDPDPQGHQNWFNYIKSTGDYNMLVGGFINSIEYRRRFGRP